MTVGGRERGYKKVSKYTIGKCTAHSWLPAPSALFFEVYSPSYSLIILFLRKKIIYTFSTTNRKKTNTLLFSDWSIRC